MPKIITKDTVIHNEKSYKKGGEYDSEKIGLDADQLDALVKSGAVEVEEEVAEEEVAGEKPAGKKKPKAGADADTAEQGDEAA